MREKLLFGGFTLFVNW